MKLPLSLLLALVCCASCSFLDDGLLSGPPRRDTHNRDKIEDGNKDEVPQDTIGTPTIDTLLFYSVVEFDSSYNWDQDSSYLAESFTVSYYQNHLKLFSLHSKESNCISQDADTHHIILGDLYTEASDNDKTYIGKNGQTILEFEGREYLKGLVSTRDGSIYTLTCDRDAEGLSLRKDGELIFRRDIGKVFGSFEDSSYGPSGALYLDLGRVTFCYKTGSGTGSRYFAVYDATEEQLREESRDIDDIKIHKGTVYYSPQNQAGYSIKDSRIWPGVRSTPVSGRFSSDKEDFYGVCPTSGTGRPVRLSYEESHLYCFNDKSFAINQDSGGSVMVNDSNGPLLSFEDSYFSSEDCASFFDNSMILGISRKKSQGPPFIYHDGLTKEVPIHGYISAVDVEVRLTN